MSWNKTDAFCITVFSWTSFYVIFLWYEKWKAKPPTAASHFLITISPRYTKRITIITITMITIFNHTFKTLSQNYYDKTIDSIHFHRLTCSCGHSACLSRHAYYHRSIKTPPGKIRLRICRVKCSFCGATHALLLAEMVPYSQIPLISQFYIARESLWLTWLFCCHGWKSWNWWKQHCFCFKTVSFFPYTC